MIKYLVFLSLTLSFFSSFALSLNKHSYYNSLTNQEFHVAGNSFAGDNLSINPYSSNHDKESSNLPLLPIENKKESEDDDDTSSHKKIVDCSKHYVSLIYLAEIGNYFEAPQTKTLFQSEFVFFIDHTLFLELEVFLI